MKLKLKYHFKKTPFSYNKGFKEVEIFVGALACLILFVLRVL